MAIGPFQESTCPTARVEHVIANTAQAELENKVNNIGTGEILAQLALLIHWDQSLKDVAQYLIADLGNFVAMHIVNQAAHDLDGPIILREGNLINEIGSEDRLIVNVQYIVKIELKDFLQPIPPGEIGGYLQRIKIELGLQGGIEQYLVHQEISCLTGNLVVVIGAMGKGPALLHKPLFEPPQEV